MRLQVYIFSLIMCLGKLLSVQAAAESYTRPDFITLVSRLSVPGVTNCPADPDQPQLNVPWTRSQLFDDVEESVMAAANARPDDINAIASRWPS